MGTSVSPWNEVFEIKFLVHDDALPAFYTRASRFVRIIDACPKADTGSSQYMCPNYECYSSEAGAYTRSHSELTFPLSVQLKLA
jgi:hypothetical protein